MRGRNVRGVEAGRVRVGFGSGTVRVRTAQQVRVTAGQQMVGGPSLKVGHWSATASSAAIGRPTGRPTDRPPPPPPRSTHFPFPRSDRNSVRPGARNRRRRKKMDRKKNNPVTDLGSKVCGSPADARLTVVESKLGRALGHHQTPAERERERKAPVANAAWRPSAQALVALGGGQ